MDNGVAYVDGCMRERQVCMWAQQASGKVCVSMPLSRHSCVTTLFDDDALLLSVALFVLVNDKIDYDCIIVILQ